MGANKANNMINRQLLLTYLYLLVYILLSSGVILYNKNTNTPNKKCKLLDWMGSGEVVAEGRWSSSDSKQLVHHIPTGPNAMRVWVDLAREVGAYLWRPTADMTYIEGAVGTIVAWPTNKVVMGQ